MANVQKLDLLCPKTNTPIEDRGSYFFIQGYPGVYFNKVHCGRTMTAAEFLQVLAGTDMKFDGFVSRAGQAFSAKLVFNPDTKRVEFPPRAPRAAEDPSGTPLAQICPKSGHPIEDRGTYYYFPGFPNTKFNKTVCSRLVTVEEYIEALTATSPVYLEGFVSIKTGKDFKAAFVFDPNAERMGFTFPPQPSSGPRSGGRPGAARSEGPSPAREEPAHAVPTAFTAADVQGF